VTHSWLKRTPINRTIDLYIREREREMSRLPLSPPEEPPTRGFPSSLLEEQREHVIVPLESPIRRVPIHPHLQEIRVPVSSTSSSTATDSATDTGVNAETEPVAGANANANENSITPALSSHQYHPVTCQAIDIDTPQFRSQLLRLRREYPSTTAALKAQEETALKVKAMMEEATRKRAKVQKALDKKVKERDMELKVLLKYQEVKASGLPP
jgi:hypothetical protein